MKLFIILASLILMAPISCSERGVIIRVDDIGTFNPSLVQLSDMATKNDINLTYSLIPSQLETRTIMYLRTLDPTRFELATHGLYHEDFSSLNESTQRELIYIATDIMKTVFGIMPISFALPYTRFNSATSKILANQGYHSMLEWNETNPDILVFYINWWWEDYPADGTVIFRAFADFKECYNTWYNTNGSRFFTIIMHQKTFRYPKQASIIEQSIQYMRQTDVEFLTEEQAYRRR